MKIRWSPEAADDFESVIRRILQDNPSNAQRVAEIIYDRIAVLTTFPNRGRPDALKARVNW
jgi:plasmid stabilization system protein ParE